MRDPSIHITKSVFADICKELEILVPTDRFFQLAKRKAINSRVVTVSNNKVKKQLTKVLLANQGDASLVADLIYSIRIKLKHRGIKKINEASGKDWDSCKKLADICNTFCNDFGFTNIREGFIKYLTIGINRMNGNNRNLIQRLIQMSENISEQYDNELELAEDKNPWETEQAFDYYIRKIAQVTGIYDNVKDPTKLVFFKRAVEIAGNNIKLWIDAQFYALSFCNGIPAPKDLVGDKALERYNKYLYKIKAKEEDLPENNQESMWSKIDRNYE